MIVEDFYAAFNVPLHFNTTPDDEVEGTVWSIDPYSAKSRRTREALMAFFLCNVRNERSEQRLRQPPCSDQRFDMCRVFFPLKMHRSINSSVPQVVVAEIHAGDADSKPVSLSQGVIFPLFVPDIDSTTEESPIRVVSRQLTVGSQLGRGSAAVVSNATMKIGLRVTSGQSKTPSDDANVNDGYLPFRPSNGTASTTASSYTFGVGDSPVNNDDLNGDEPLGTQLENHSTSKHTTALQGGSGLVYLYCDVAVKIQKRSVGLSVREMWGSISFMARRAQLLVDRCASTTMIMQDSAFADKVTFGISSSKRSSAFSSFNRSSGLKTQNSSPVGGSFISVSACSGPENKPRSSGNRSAGTLTNKNGAACGERKIMGMTLTIPKRGRNDSLVKCIPTKCDREMTGPRTQDIEPESVSVEACMPTSNIGRLRSTGFGKAVGLLGTTIRRTTSHRGLSAADEQKLRPIPLLREPSGDRNFAGLRQGSVAGTDAIAMTNDARSVDIRIKPAGEPSGKQRLLSRVLKCASESGDKAGMAYSQANFVAWNSNMTATEGDYPESLISVMKSDSLDQSKTRVILGAAEEGLVSSRSVIFRSRHLEQLLIVEKIDMAAILKQVNFIGRGVAATGSHSDHLMSLNVDLKKLFDCFCDLRFPFMVGLQKDNRLTDFHQLINQEQILDSDNDCSQQTLAQAQRHLKEIPQYNSEIVVGSTWLTPVEMYLFSSWQCRCDCAAHSKMSHLTVVASDGDRTGFEWAQCASTSAFAPDELTTDVATTHHNSEETDDLNQACAENCDCVDRTHFTQDSQTPGSFMPLAPPSFKVNPAAVASQTALVLPTVPMGVTLHNLLNEAFLKRRKRPSGELSLFFVYQLCELVAQMHEVGVIHSDVKPDNFLVFSMELLSRRSREALRGSDANEVPDKEVKRNSFIGASPNMEAQLSENWMNSHPLLAAGQPTPVGVAGIDLGRCLDMKSVYKNTLFGGNCHADDFRPPMMLLCVEEPKGPQWDCEYCNGTGTDESSLCADARCPLCMRPPVPGWAYHIDMFGIAVIIHCMLFGKYLKVRPVGEGMDKSESNDSTLASEATLKSRVDKATDAETRFAESLGGELGAAPLKSVKYRMVETLRRYQSDKTFWYDVLDSLINFSPVVHGVTKPQTISTSVTSEETAELDVSLNLGAQSALLLRRIQWRIEELFTHNYQRKEKLTQELVKVDSILKQSASRPPSKPRAPA
eukprot:Lankesteria_metandrocarpae@DN3375_c0_g1_i1.p1